MLKGFLMEHALYSTDEFYQITWNDNDFYQCYDLCILYTVIYTILGIQITWSDYDFYPCYDLCKLYTIIYTIFTHIQGVSKRALQLWKLIEIYTEDIHKVLNCQNVAKHTEFHLG